MEAWRTLPFKFFSPVLIVARIYEHTNSTFCNKHRFHSPKIRDAREQRWRNSYLHISQYFLKIPHTLFGCAGEPAYFPIIFNSIFRMWLGGHLIFEYLLIFPYFSPLPGWWAACACICEVRHNLHLPEFPDFPGSKCLVKSLDLLADVVICVENW